MDTRSTIAEIKIRTSTGQGWFYEIKNALMIGATLKVILGLRMIEAVALTLFSLVGFFIIGVLDYDFMRVQQKIFELTTSKYNKHLNKIK